MTLDLCEHQFLFCNVRTWTLNVLAPAGFIFIRIMLLYFSFSFFENYTSSIFACFLNLFIVSFWRLSPIHRRHRFPSNLWHFHRRHFKKYFPLKIRRWTCWENLLDDTKIRVYLHNVCLPIYVFPASFVLQWPRCKGEIMSA